MDTVFNTPVDRYTNQVNPVSNYAKQLVFYKQIMYGTDYNTAKTEVIDYLRANIKDKTIRYFQREENQDRTVQTSSLLEYIKQAKATKSVLAPTFTTYLSKDVKTSVLADYTNSNTTNRAKVKKLAQKYKAEGNTALAISKNLEQTLYKLYNNSLSGAFAQESCILHNPTSHSTLTSVTRTMASLANTSNEKIIAGNRYYPRPEDVFNDCLYIASKANTKLIKSVITKYNLHIPSVEETIEVLKHSSDLYFSNYVFFSSKLVPFITKLSGYHRAAICYISDLYHIKQFNKDFMRNFLMELSWKSSTKTVDSSYIDKLYSVNEDILNFAHQIHFDEVKGNGKDYSKMNELGITYDLYQTSVNIVNVLDKYKDFIACFFLTDISPFNSHRIAHMRRRAVVLSDTDSTCFTVDKWVEFYTGKIEITPITIAVGSAVAFITTQVIAHALAQFSANLGVHPKDLKKLAMKNEYLWTVHMPAEVSKHYTAYTVMQEGIVYSKPEIEIKGVHFKNSAVPIDVIKDGKEFIELILSSIHNNQEFTLSDCIKRVVNIEQTIIRQIKSSNVDYFNKSKIKDKEAYAKGEDESPYGRHLFWVEVFGDKYGTLKEPPYDVVKIPTTITTNRRLKEWVESIDDTSVKNKLAEWLVRRNKNNLPTIYLDFDLVEGNGIPVEIANIIDIKRVVLDTTRQHRLILGALGMLLDEQMTVSEAFPTLV